jgi:ABC-2 type transport system permease protein
MIWYIITAETICFGVPVKLLSDAISSDIRNGNIASHLNKPYNYVLYSISRYLGNIFIKLCIFVCTAILLGLLLAGPIECFSVKNICFIIIAFVFAVSVSLTTISIISMSAFWMEDNKPLLWLYSKVLLVFGILFPIDIFPQWLYNIARITPIFPTIYGPSKLMINYSASFFLKVLFMQIIYLAAGIYLCVLVYANGVKKLNVNGG